MWLSRAGVWLICISFVMPSAAVPADGPEAPQELPKTVAVRGVQKWSGYRGACTSLDEVVAYYYNVSGERIRASLCEVLQANASASVSPMQSATLQPQSARRCAAPWTYDRTTPKP